MSVIVVDYGSGNTRSVVRAVAEAGAGGGVRLTDDPDLIASAERLILPGVGHFADCARGLSARPGVMDALHHAARVRGAPFLGICVGMQLLADAGLEDGETPGLGWIGGRVERLDTGDARLPIPHMGWNELEIVRPHPVTAGLGARPNAYFVHSFAFSVIRPDDVAVTIRYGSRVTAAVGRDNLFGTQFHPEKSQAVGQKVLENFLDWRP
ncbi:imidazole glycerol phosphate synthase subunit HisH [bacterium]|nr:imidazole glycerol phosphate synthase subunit HisH [bacterium]